MEEKTAEGTRPKTKREKRILLSNMWETNDHSRPHSILWAKVLSWCTWANSPRGVAENEETGKSSKALTFTELSTMPLKRKEATEEKLPQKNRHRLF
jgi:hypothetical protein